MVVYPAHMTIDGNYILVGIEFKDINSLDADKQILIKHHGYENDPLYIFAITMGYDTERINNLMNRYINEKIGVVFHVELQNITTKRYKTNKSSLRFDL